LKKYILDIKDSYIRYVHPKWWFWTKLIFSIIIFGLVLFMFLYWELFALLFIYPIVLFAVLAAVLGKEVEKGRRKELQIKIEERERLKLRYFKDVLVKDKVFRDNFMCVPDTKKADYLEILFDIELSKIEKEIKT
jgi:hypothetical protein